MGVTGRITSNCVPMGYGMTAMVMNGAPTSASLWSLIADKWGFMHDPKNGDKII
jgi:hypothetical protein